MANRSGFDVLGSKNDESARHEIEQRAGQHANERSHLRAGDDLRQLQGWETSSSQVIGEKLIKLQASKVSVITTADRQITLR